MKKTSAVSLVELIVVIFIFALFLGVAVPSMFSWTTSSQVKADFTISLELHQIITDAIKSNDINFSSTTGFLNWDSSTKTKLRSLIMREMGTSSWDKVKIPRQYSYAFFVYLLPPYNVVCLPIDNTTTNFDTSLSFNGVTKELLLERYPKSSYPQMYVSNYTTQIDPDTNETYSSVGVPELLIPNILLPNTTPDNDKLNSYVGCLNIKTDYD